MSVSQQASVAIFFTHVQRTLHKSDTLFSLRSKKSATRKSLGKDNSLSRFVRRPRFYFGDIFRRRDATWRDATRCRENASPKKSIILLVSRARARARAQIGAGDLFSDDRGVPGATFTRGLSYGRERRSNYILLCLSTTHLSTRTRCSFSSSFSLSSSFLLLLPFPWAALPLAPPRRVLQAPPTTIGRAPNRTRSLVKSSRDLRKFPPDDLHRL